MKKPSSLCASMSCALINRGSKLRLMEADDICEPRRADSEKKNQKQRRRSQKKTCRLKSHTRVGIALMTSQLTCASSSSKSIVQAFAPSFQFPTVDRENEKTKKKRKRRRNKGEGYDEIYITLLDYLQVRQWTSNICVIRIV